MGKILYIFVADVKAGMDYVDMVIADKGRAYDLNVLRAKAIVNIDQLRSLADGESVEVPCDKCGASVVVNSVERVVDVVLCVECETWFKELKMNREIIEAGIVYRRRMQ
jgi:hypothetical protein